MSDTVPNLEPGQVAIPSTGETAPATEINYKEEYTKNKEALAQLEQEKDLLKKDVAGQSKKNSEIFEKLKALEEKELTKEELFEKQRTEWQEQQTEQSKELAAKQREIDLSNAVNTLGLDPELKVFIPGANYEEFIENGKILKDKLTALVETGTKTQLGAVDKNKPLEAGVSLGVAERYDAALKNKDPFSALKIIQEGKAG